MVRLKADGRNCDLAQRAERFDSQSPRCHLTWMGAVDKLSQKTHLRVGPAGWRLDDGWVWSPGCVAICSDTRRRDWGARGSLSLKPITAFGGCVRSTVSWMDSCVKESLLYKPGEDLSTLSRNDYHFKYGNVWVRSGSRVSAERLIQNQFTVFLFSLKVPHCRTATQSIFCDSAVYSSSSTCAPELPLSISITRPAILSLHHGRHSKHNCHRSPHFSIFWRLFESLAQVRWTAGRGQVSARAAWEGEN